MLNYFSIYVSVSFCMFLRLQLFNRLRLFDSLEYLSILCTDMIEGKINAKEKSEDIVSKIIFQC